MTLSAHRAGELLGDPRLWFGALLHAGLYWDPRSSLAVDDVGEHGAARLRLRPTGIAAGNRKLDSIVSPALRRGLWCWPLSRHLSLPRSSGAGLRQGRLLLPSHADRRCSAALDAFCHSCRDRGTGRIGCCAHGLFLTCAGGSGAVGTTSKFHAYLARVLAQAARQVNDRAQHDCDKQDSGQHRFRHLLPIVAIRQDRLASGQS